MAGEKQAAEKTVAVKPVKAVSPFGDRRASRPPSELVGHAKRLLQSAMHRYVVMGDLDSATKLQKFVKEL